MSVAPKGVEKITTIFVPGNAMGHRRATDKRFLTKLLVYRAKQDACLRSSAPSAQSGVVYKIATAWFMATSPS